MRALLAMCAALFCALAAKAADEAVLADLSQSRVSITASFEGSEIFIFGAVKRQSPPPVDMGPLEVIIVIEGPGAAPGSQNWENRPILVRRKERLLGVWVNTDAVEVDQAPHFFAIASTGPIREILSYTDALRHRIGLDHSIKLIEAPADVEDAQAFREAVVRVRRDQGLYIELPGSVDLTEETLFKTRVELPSNLVEGDYRARVFLTRDRNVLDRFETVIAVRKVGLERWIYTLAHERPLIYGILAIVVALSAGWAADAVFRRLRR